MRTRHFLSCLNWLCVFVLMAEELSAQALFEERHIPYTSDSLWVYKLPYISVGDSGLHCIWDFSTIWTDSVEVVEADYFAAHSNDTTYIGLHRERANYYYHHAHDTLWMIGYENARMHMHYSQPAPLLRFPFVYGDTLGGTISGNGRYCHTIPFTLEGISYVQVDASGRLILPDMTIENALRVHSKIRYTSRMNRRLTYVEEERYQWYSAYCRYPLLESIKSCTMTNRDTIYFASSYYLPQNQDTVLVREKDPDNITDAESESMITDVRYYPNPVSTELQIYYRLSQSAHVYVSMHYNGGITTYQSPVHQECVGEHMLPVNMGGMPIGNYVVYIHANDTVVSGNIIKY